MGIAPDAPIVTTDTGESHACTPDHRNCARGPFWRRADRRLRASQPHQRASGQVLDDRVITAKVRKELFEQKGVSVMDVQVSTYRGEVQLSGFVPSEKEARLMRGLAVLTVVAVAGCAGPPQRDVLLPPYVDKGCWERLYEQPRFVGAWQQLEGPVFVESITGTPISGTRLAAPRLFKLLCEATPARPDDRLRTTARPGFHTAGPAVRATC
jgi:hypothetical protein